ncbi:uncharacterized protein [Cicer arietinum]|uniref:B3 domain-containing protein LOC_Os12g40080-like isoform X4 n=1 Tax=Cicer arietinum TaxID=3827 RepID=A0A3Q7YAS0_CICAR|nr:B3 domain-containing protein LOC_Os12g40080-like isoform X4 [Cicer arietinum]
MFLKLIDLDNFVRMKKSASIEVVPIHKFFEKLTFVVNVVCSSTKRHDEIQAPQLEEIAHLLEVDEIVTDKAFQSSSANIIPSFSLKHSTKFCSLEDSTMSSQQFDHGVHFFKVILQKSIQEGKLDPSSSRRKRPKSPPSSSKVYKKVKIISKERKECKHEKSKVLAHARFYSSKHMDNVAGSSCGNILKRSRVLHEKVKNEFNCEKDFFISVIHKTYIQRDLLVIPRDFSKIHLHRMEGRNATIFVDQDRTWNVDLKLTRNDQFTLSGGWNKFRHHNNVKYGDVCVFILNKIKGTVSFQVVIFSLEKEITAPYFE